MTSDFVVEPFVPWPNKPRSGDALSEWHVHNYVRLLDYVGDIVKRLDAERDWSPPTYKPHRMTYLKLLMSTSYARTFMHVGSRHTSDLRYLDILSASGLSYPGGGPHAVPGSCFFAPLGFTDFEAPSVQPKHGFTQMWAFDGDQTNLDALQWRHQQLMHRVGLSLPRLHTVAGNVNETIPALVKGLGQEAAQLWKSRRAPLYLAFVDNEALDVDMDTLQAIQNGIRADVIIHIPTSSIYRLVRQHDETGHDQKRLTAFFGGDTWRDARSEDQTASIYRDQVQQRTGGEFQVLDPVHIRGEKHTFSLVVCARKTVNSGDKGWVARNERLATACNQFDLEKMDYVLNRVLHGQRSIMDFGL